MRDPLRNGSQRWNIRGLGRGFDADDPSLNRLFAHNPIRRSAVLVLVCLIVVVACAVVVGRSSQNAAILLLVAALAGAVLILAIPLLIWNVLAELTRTYRRRTSPDIAVLKLSARSENILRRSNIETIADLIAQDDEALLALRRMEAHDLREIRRALSLWQYRNWQEAGFPLQ